MRVKKHSGWFAGLRCGECGHAYESGTVCPQCGAMDRGEDVAVRRTWTTINMEWLNALMFNVFDSEITLEAKDAEGTG